MNDLLPRLTYVLCASLMLVSCGSGSRSDRASDDVAFSTLPAQFYEPGLGDLMSVLQLRHAKLWYAAEADNWPLVDFELHEIEETFERIARWHPEEHGMPVAPALEGYMRAAHEALETSAANEDRAGFEAAFDLFTAGCNACHRAMKHGFIVIQRPTREPVTNQRWDTIRI